MSAYTTFINTTFLFKHDSELRKILQRRCNFKKKYFKLCEVLQLLKHIIEHVKRAPMTLTLRPILDQIIKATDYVRSLHWVQRQERYHPSWITQHSPPLFMLKPDFLHVMRLTPGSDQNQLHFTLPQEKELLTRYIIS